MNKIKIILLIAFLYGITTTQTSCKEDKKRLAQIDSTNTLNGELNVQLTEKEVALQEFIVSFNEIQQTLIEIKEKEKVVNAEKDKKGDVKSKQALIIEDIKAIHELIAKNKQKIGALQAKLKDANSNIQGLKEMIANLETQIVNKDIEIEELKVSLQKSHIEIQNLATNLDNSEKESAAKTKKINQAYYLVGTKAQLLEHGIITKEGGFIGIGKTAKINDNFDKSKFTLIDIRKTSEITIDAKKVKILSNHPQSSYKLVVGDDKVVEKLEILNAEDFWSSSKYIVIVAD